MLLEMYKLNTRSAPPPLHTSEEQLQLDAGQLARLVVVAQVQETLDGRPIH